VRARPVSAAMAAPVHQGADRSASDCANIRASAGAGTSGGVPKRRRVLNRDPDAPAQRQVSAYSGQLSTTLHSASSASTTGSPSGRPAA